MTIVDFACRRDRIRLEIALLFGSIGVAVLLQAFTKATGTQIPYSTVASTVFLLMQPYLLIRLLSQFRQVPRLQHVIALACFIVSSSLIVISQGNGCNAHNRFVAAGSGSGFLALIFLLLPIATIAPSIAVPLQVTSQVFAVASALIVMLAADGDQLMIRSAGNSLQTPGMTHAVIPPDGVLAQARNERKAVAADTSLPWETDSRSWRQVLSALAVSLSAR